MAYYCLHELHWKPSDYDALTPREKAFIIAAIEIRVENEKKKEQAAKRAARRR